MWCVYRRAVESGDRASVARDARIPGAVRSACRTAVWRGPPQLSAGDAAEQSDGFRCTARARARLLQHRGGASLDPGEYRTTSRRADAASGRRTRSSTDRGACIVVAVGRSSANQPPGRRFDAIAAHESPNLPAHGLLSGVPVSGFGGRQQRELLLRAAAARACIDPRQMPPPEQSAAGLRRLLRVYLFAGLGVPIRAL